MADLVDRERLGLTELARGVECLFLKEEADLVAGFLEIGIAGMCRRGGGENGGVRLGVEVFDQLFRAALESVAELGRHEVFDHQISVLGEGLRHFLREAGIAALEAPRLLGEDRVHSAHAVPCFSGARPRCDAIVWPISAKLPRMPTECGLKSGPKNITGTCSRV